jgi:hypothetical protein
MAPPLVGDAVKFTLVPWQTLVAEPERLMLTGRFGLTAMVTELEVAGEPEAQVEFDVTWQVITSALAGL